MKFCRMLEIPKEKNRKSLGEGEILVTLRYHVLSLEVKVFDGVKNASKTIRSRNVKFCLKSDYLSDPVLPKWIEIFATLTVKNVKKY